LNFLSKDEVNFNTPKTKNLNIQDVSVGSLNVTFFVSVHLTRIWLEANAKESFGNSNSKALRELSSSSMPAAAQKRGRRVFKNWTNSQSRWRRVFPSLWG
jgi:hypothetical protein